MMGTLPVAPCDDCKNELGFVQSPYVELVLRAPIESWNASETTRALLSSLSRIEGAAVTFHVVEHDVVSGEMYLDGRLFSTGDLTVDSEGEAIDAPIPMLLTDKGKEAVQGDAE